MKGEGSGEGGLGREWVVEGVRCGGGALWRGWAMEGWFVEGVGYGEVVCKGVGYRE